MRFFISSALSGSYRVMEASDGKEALQILNRHLPDMVISDIVMPEMSGTDLCRMIKTDLTTCHIPVVMLTARTTVQQNLEGLYAGADDYISKPFNLDILLARCNNLVNNRAMLREKFSSEVQTTPQMLATNPLDKKLIEQVIDAYIVLFMKHPCLPLFMAREIQRDSAFLLQMARREQIDHYVHKIIRSLQAEMDEGKLKKVPLLTVFYTFYGLLVFPFLTRKLAEDILLEKGETFEDILAMWKGQVVKQIGNLLDVDA